MTERIPDYKLPREAERALRDAQLPGRYLPMSAVAMLRCAACHFSRGEAITATNVARCTQMGRSNVSHGLTKLVTRGILEARDGQSLTGYPHFGLKVYSFTDTTAGIAPALPSLSHCKYRLGSQSQQ